METHTLELVKSPRWAAVLCAPDACPVRWHRGRLWEEQWNWAQVANFSFIIDYLYDLEQDKWS